MKQEAGFGLLPILSGIGILVAILAVAIVLTGTMLAGNVRAAERQAMEQGDLLHAVTVAAFALGEGDAYATPLTASDIENVRNASIGRVAISALEDESAKVNVNTMPYVLPLLLMRIGKLETWDVEPLAAALAEYQGLMIGRTQSNIPYLWRPPAVLTLAVEPEGTPGGASGDDRHLMLGRFGPPLPNWRPLETPESLYALLEDPALAPALGKTIPFLTTAPTAAVNVNTCSLNVLHVLMLWQRDVLLCHPEYTQAIDALVMNQPDPPYASVTNRLYGSATPKIVKTLMNPRFRGKTETSAANVIKGRPYAPPEVLQSLQRHSFLFPFRYEWYHWGMAATEAVHLNVTGPGPYTAHSAGFYRFRLKGAFTTVDVLLAVGGGAERRIVQWQVQ